MNRHFISLYADPAARAERAASITLRAACAGGGVRAFAAFDAAAEAHQRAIYREHCARLLHLDREDTP